MMIYDFGLRLKELRKDRGLSQQDVADRLELTRHSISSYERNIVTPSLDQLVKLAVLYHTSLDYLMGLDNRPHVYLDGLTDSQQKTILDVVSRMREEFESKK